jgi:hypothetical protein
VTGWVDLLLVAVGGTFSLPVFLVFLLPISKTQGLEFASGTDIPSFAHIFKLQLVHPTFNDLPHSRGFQLCLSSSRNCLQVASGIFFLLFFSTQLCHQHAAK